MVIGVDAGALAECDERLHIGVYRVTFELLKHLSLIDPINTYRLYSYASIPDTVMKNFGKNMINISLTPSFGYMTLRLPVELSLKPVDLFLGVAQAIPFGTQPSIGCIYDLGFLHHPDLYKGNAKKLERQTRYVTKWASHIITISKTSKEDIMKTYAIDKKNITVAYPGVSDVFIKNKGKMHNSVPYFLMVGVNPSKNIPLAVRSFFQFLKLMTEKYDLIIIGGNTASTTHHAHRIHFLGRLPDSEVAKWYKGAVGLLALSVTEGFCLPAVEALASGCPVIYANGGALPEIVGKAGIGITIENGQSIVDAMIKLIKRKIYTKEIAGKYQWQVFANKIYDHISRHSHAQ